MRKICYILIFCFGLLLFAGEDSLAAMSQSRCFDSCMKSGTKYPGECQLSCKRAEKQYKRDSKSRQQQQLQQQEQLLRNQLEQQRLWDEAKKAQEAADRLDAADRAIQNASRVNLMCYRACYIEYQQKMFCEKHCAKPEEKVEGEIYTGDMQVDSLIVDCYRGCAERDDLTPACFHTCCYICNKEQFDEESGYVENPWLTRCKKNCRHKGLKESECEDICLGNE